MNQKSIDIPPGFETHPCEICGNNTRKPIAKRTDLFLGGDIQYSMYECQECYSIYQYPRPCPNKMDDFYPSDYQQYTPAVHKESRIASFFRRYGLRKRCEIITEYVKSGLLLDVGCATGDFLSEMSLVQNWNTVGIEPIYSATKYAYDEVGLTVIQGNLNEAPFCAEAFDAITMWDVIEHVYDPKEVIARASRLLNPGGILVINHPNLNSIDRRLFGDLWLGYELPRHLYLFPESLLRQLMEDVGLEEIEQKCLYGSHAATMTSMMFILEKKFEHYPKITTLFRKFLFGKTTRILFTPYFKIIDHFKLGSNITVIFQKNHE